MKQSDVNHLFAVPWAAQADSSTIASIPTTATAIGRASMALGFPKSTMTPIAAGGVPPYGEDMNGILSMLSVAARASEAGLLRPFSADFANAIGGYPAGATVAHPSISGRFLICTQDGNENDPASNMAGWADPLAGLASASSVQNLVSGVWGASIKDGDRQGVGLFWQGVSQAPCFVRLESDGSTPFTALVTRAQIDSWLSGYASNAALDAAKSSLNSAIDDARSSLNNAIGAETNRAQAAENGRVAKAGDTMAGTLILNSGNAFAPWASSPQNIYQIGNGLLSIWGQVFGNGNVGLILGGNNPGQPYRNWRFDPTAGTVSTPSGNNLMETSNTKGVRLKQCFRVSVANGRIVSWPIIYSSDAEVFVTFTPTDSGNGQVHIVNLIVGTTTNRFNCTVAVSTWNKNNSGVMKAEVDPITVDVVVEGYI